MKMQIEGQLMLEWPVGQDYPEVAGSLPENWLVCLQSAVDGYVEPVPLSAAYMIEDGSGSLLIGSAWVDQDGRLKQKPLNVAASRFFGQMLFGTVAFICDPDTYTAPLPVTEEELREALE